MHVFLSTSTIGDLDNYSSDDTEVSPLEMKRMKNIERNKKKMDEIFGTKLKEKTSSIKTKQLAPVPAKRKGWMRFLAPNSRKKPQVLK